MPLERKKSVDTVGIPDLPSTETVPESAVWNNLRNGPSKVCILGSGNWGSAIAKVIGRNTQKYFFFKDEVDMWVFEEKINGKNLTEIINETHINVKYLPDIVLPSNIHAEPDLLKAVRGAKIIVFVMPHQFVPNVCARIASVADPSAVAISLCKGFDAENGDFRLISEMIRDTLNIDVSVLSGANVARDVAREQFAEATIGYKHVDSAQLLQQLFDTPWFRVNAVPDVVGVELCGALKNVVALGAGFVDGLDLGTNTKSAILRIGIVEMRKFAVEFFSGIVEETFWDSCGFADLVTTCFGGRNRKCAERYARTGQPWDQIEKELLNGQKLQGTHAAVDVYAFLTKRRRADDYPLFTTIYKIVTGELQVIDIVNTFKSNIPRAIQKTGTPIARL